MNGLESILSVDSTTANAFKTTIRRKHCTPTPHGTQAKMWTPYPHLKSG